MEIKRADASYLKHVQEVEKVFPEKDRETAEGIMETLKNPEGLAYVAYKNDKPVGAVYGAPIEDVANNNPLYAEDEFGIYDPENFGVRNTFFLESVGATKRGQGIGQSLMDKLIGNVKERGYKRITGTSLGEEIYGFFEDKYNAERIKTTKNMYHGYNNVTEQFEVPGIYFVIDLED